MQDSHHPQAQGDGTPGKSNSARAREGEKSGWKRKRTRTEGNEKRGNKLADRKKLLPHWQTTKEFVMYSCNICGFTKEKFEALMEYTRPAPPDAIVLVETNLSFTYTPDYVEEAGWKIYTTCGPSKSGSRADASTGGVSLLVRTGSVKVKTEILMKNESHQLVTWALSNSDRGVRPLVYISGVYLAPRAKIPISRTVKALKLLQNSFVLPRAPDSSSASSSVYHIITGDFNAYTGEVQETCAHHGLHGSIPRRIGDVKHLPRDSIMESGATTEPEQRGHLLLRLVNDLKLLIVNGRFEPPDSPPPLTTKTTIVDYFILHSEVLAEVRGCRIPHDTIKNAG